jgi:alkylated DNA repair dioxygenase AlkB
MNELSIPEAFVNSLQQSELFAAASPALDGFAYRENILTLAEEDALISAFETVTFEPFQFRGFIGKRRVASFGWKYDFNRTRLCEAPAIPDFLLELQDKVAAMRGCDDGAFDQLSISEYEPGAGIGWHKDRPVFDAVVGISLGAACRLRLRRKRGGGWERQSFEIAPRSAYLIDGSARWEWEHSIPPVDALRYSITFRRLLAQHTPG